MSRSARSGAAMSVTDPAATSPPTQDPSLVSQHLRRRLADGNAAPGTLTVSGVVLLSDVVGFTSHIEEMSAQGREGLEAFTTGLSWYIDRLITMVLSRGGDVLCIAGDSLLCLWEADDEDGLREAAIAAASTALDIQETTDGHPLAADRVIRTRIGIAAGPMTLTVAGGASGRWELLTHGETIERVDEAERSCEPGRVTLDPTAAALLAEHAASMPVGDGLFEIDTWFTDRRTADDEADPGGLDPWAMEFRRLSIAMVRVPELADAPPETSHRIVHDFQAIIDRFEGTSSVVTDNKGVRLLATFGVAGLAHEDDAARAIGAIRMFVAQLAEIGYTCAAGIATGRVLHGVTGNRERRSQTIAGEVINVAARLSTTAVDEVLCDQETAVSARGHYSFAVMNPITVKGKATPVPVFEPTEVAGPRRGAVAVRGRATSVGSNTGTGVALPLTVIGFMTANE